MTPLLTLCRNRGCGGEYDRFVNKIFCCNDKFFPNHTSELQPLYFEPQLPPAVGMEVDPRSLKFSAEEFAKRLGPLGTLTFVGDSISEQTFTFLRSRLLAAGFYNTLIPDVPLAALALKFVTKLKSPRVEFFMELYRIDRLKNSTAQAQILDKAMPLGRTASGQSKKLVALAPASKRVQEYLEDPQGTATRLGLAAAVDASTDAAPHPKHIVVSNIGLHYTSGFKRVQNEYRERLEGLVQHTGKFNANGHHNFGFLRESSPQHFKSDGGQGEYSNRDASVNQCWPWAPDTVHSSTTTLNKNNELMHKLAADYKVPVQTISTLLSDRPDAHIETRSEEKNFILDCTHWCAQVSDVFEDTLLHMLRTRYMDVHLSRDMLRRQGWIEAEANDVDGDVDPAVSS